MTNHLVIDRRRGVWLGVCRGVADYAGLDVTLLRLLVVLLTVLGAGLPAVVAYVLTGWLAGER
jgi:phage shock protein C